MGTGKRRISTAARIEGKAEGGPVLELELVLVEAELELVLVQGELEHVPVAAERELVQVEVEVEAVPLPGQPLAQLVEQVRAQPAVALRTKSATAAHRRGLVLLLTVEDLAAEVVETTHRQAAAEAVTAWEAAATVAVVAVEA
jgi:hypothetical protein